MESELVDTNDVMKKLRKKKKPSKEDLFRILFLLEIKNPNPKNGHQSSQRIPKTPQTLPSNWTEKEGS